MRDQLVRGINDETIQRQLLAESPLDFRNALELATMMETADKNMHNIQEGNFTEKPKKKPPVNRISKEKAKKSAKECYRSGGLFHKAEKSRY